MRRVSAQVEIDAPIQTVFDLFGRFDNFPRWMQGVASVERSAPGRTHWMVIAPDGTRVEWEAEITRLELNEQVSWHSIHGDVSVAGDAELAAVARGRTLLTLTLGYGESEWLPNEALVRLLTENQRLRDDLRRFKLLAEREAQIESGVNRSSPRGVAPAVTTATATAAVDDSSIHFEPLSQLRRSRQRIRPARPLRTTRDDQPPKVVPSQGTVRTTNDHGARRSHRTSRSTVPRAVVGPARDRRSIFSYLVPILLLGLAVGAGWFLASRWVNDSGTQSAVQPTPSPTARPKERRAAPTDRTAVPSLAASPAPASKPAAVVADEGKAAEPAVDAGTRAQVRATIDNWIAATNERDIDRQLDFYAPSLQRYYRQGDTSKDAVRADKVRNFAAAESVQISAAEPEITLEPGGRTVRVRFRKQYEITGSEGARSGEVLQELRLAKAGDDWKIISERDLRVIK